MRPAICLHGVDSRAPRGDSPPARISASWLSVTHGWSSGVSLNDMTQMTVHAKLATPSAMNDVRHPYRATTASTIGGVTAPPSLAQLCVTPWAKPRSRGGSHQVNARVAVGNAPPSPMPTSTRQTTSDSTLHDRPVRIVAAAHSELSAVRTQRGPNRSDAQPPAICIAAYGYAKAEKIMPSSIGVSPRSFRIAGPATEMFTRSTYATKYIRHTTNRMRCLTFSADRRALLIMLVRTYFKQHDIPRVFSLQRHHWGQRG